MVQLVLSSVELSPSPVDAESPLPVDAVAHRVLQNATPPSLVDAVAHRVQQDQPPLPVDAESFPRPPRPPRPPSPAAPVLRDPVEPLANMRTPAPHQAHVDAPPRPQRNIKPDYPRGARQRGEQGDVQVEFTVADDGTVTEAHIISSCGFAELDDSALAAIRRTRFVPAKAEGRPVASTARITLLFKLK